MMPLQSANFSVNVIIREKMRGKIIAMVFALEILRDHVMTVFSSFIEREKNDKRR